MNRSKSRIKSAVSLERLKELLEYYPESGDFIWRISLGSCQAGSQAGTKIGSGYGQIQIDGICYKTHRLAWLYVNGVWPSSDLDHKNTIKLDNRISNLRECSRQQNSANVVASRNSKTGIKGVSFHQKTGKYTAQIGVNWKVIYLGVFGTIEEAKAVYDAAAKKYFGEFARAA